MDWYALAENAILEVLDREHSVTTRELEARISNDPWPSVGKPIDPDIVKDTRNALFANGVLGRSNERTRGGKKFATWHRRDVKGRSTAIARAAARKRLLAARHDSWSRSTDRHPKGLIGRAGEEALRRTLEEDDHFTTIRQDPSQALGTETRGPVDFSAYLVSEEADRPTVHTALFEMKNQRQWFFPIDPDLHRFLYKAAQVQVDNPDQPTIPVFVSARRQYWAWELGRILGCYMVQYGAQFVLDASEVDRDRFREVYDELGYSDLVLGTTPNNHLRRAVQESLPRNVGDNAARWGLIAGHTIDLHEQVMDSRDPNNRSELVLQMESVAIGAAGPPPDYEPLPKGRL